MSGMEKFAQTVGSAVAGCNRSQWDNSAPQTVARDNDWAAVAAAARCWAQSGDGFFPVTEVVEKIPAGAYRTRMSDRGPYLEKMPIEIDSLLHLPDSASEVLLAEFKKFWTLRDNFAKHGFIYKRGMLLWGPPGSGKTSAIWQMTQELVRNQNGIVIFIEYPELAAVCVGFVRRIEPTRPLICIYEDLDALIVRNGEHNFLAMLDGETQISDVVHVATTNYPERLDKRFVDRPSRFDTIMLIDMPSADARRAYLKQKDSSLDEVTLARWVSKTDGYSVAHLREVIIAVRCFEQAESEVFERLNMMRTERPASDGLGGLKAGKIGFGS